MPRQKRQPQQPPQQQQHQQAPSLPSASTKSSTTSSTIEMESTSSSSSPPPLPREEERKFNSNSNSNSNTKQQTFTSTPRKGIRWFVHPPSFTLANRHSPEPNKSSNKLGLKQRRPATTTTTDTDTDTKPEKPTLSLEEQLRRELKEARAEIRTLKERETKRRTSSEKEQVTCAAGGGRRLFPEKNKKVATATATANQSSTALRTTTPRTVKTQHEKVSKSVTQVANPLAAVPWARKKGLSSSTKEEEEKEDSPTTKLDKEMAQPFWHMEAFENIEPTDGTRIPPGEVLAIQDRAIDQSNLQLRLQDAEVRAKAYRSKLEKADDLVASLFRDLERAKRNIHALVSRNMALSSLVKGIRVDQEDNMMYRSSLVKACIYISPVFVLCGGLEAFLSTIVLVWVLIEIEAALLLDDDDEEEEKKQKELPKKLLHNNPNPSAAIPENIVLPISTSSPTR